MLKQTALDFVGKPTTGIAETKVPGDPGDVALDGALVRAFDGIDDAARGRRVSSPATPKSR